MGLSPDTMRQVALLLQPMAIRQRNMIARAQVLLVDDGKKLQSLQVAVPETVPDGEHYQPYGFSSIPLAGAEGVALFPSGDRGHPLVIVMSDRRYRPTGGQPGEVTVYNNTGASMTITKDGDIIATPAPGRKMLVHGAGTAAPLATLADLQALATFVQGMTLPVSGATAGPPPPASVPTPTGTTVLEAE